MRYQFDILDLSLVTLIAEGNSLTHAAQRASLSLPAVSLRIKNLEEALGVKLFHRTRQGVTLTDAGAKFVHHALRMLQQVEELRDEMHEYSLGARGSLRVYATTTAVTEFLPSVLGQYLLKHPEVRVDLVEQKGDDTVAAIRDGSADIGIISNTVYSEGLYVEPYCTLRLVLVTGANHPATRKKSIAFSETLDYDYVGLPDSSAYQHFMVVASSMAKKGLNIRVRVNNFEAICRMAELNIGVGLLPESAARRNAETMDIKIIPLADPWSLRQLLLCARSKDGLPPYAQALMRQLIEDGCKSMPTARRPVH